MEKVVVTGGGGFLGSAIVRRLLSRGVSTTVIGRRGYPHIEALGCQVLSGDIRDADFLRQAFAGVDTVFHVAALAGIWGSRKLYQEINVGGTGNVLAACRANHVKHLIYTSSPSVVFGHGDLCGVNEQTPYPNRYLCHYARTKAQAEQMVLAASCDRLLTTALRPHLIWGPGDPHLIPRLVDRARRGRLRQVGDGKNLVDITYIDNAADAHLLAAENLADQATAAGRAYFISQGEPVNLWSWINQVLRRLEIPKVEQRVGFRSAYVAGSMLELVYRMLRLQKEPIMTRFLAEQLARSHWFSIEKAERDFGYSPRISTAKGIQELASWWRQANQAR